MGSGKGDWEGEDGEKEDLCVGAEDVVEMEIGWNQHPEGSSKPVCEGGLYGGGESFYQDWLLWAILQECQIC